MISFISNLLRHPIITYIMSRYLNRYHGFCLTLLHFYVKSITNNNCIKCFQTLVFLTFARGILFGYCDLTNNNLLVYKLQTQLS